MMKELRRREAADRAPRMSIVYRAIDQLELDPANARRHSKKQIRQIAESIKTFGFDVPILIDHDGKVVAGHGRLLACRLLGMAEVPTLGLDHLTAAQARAFMIADNRLTEIATWDDRLLAQQLKELSLSGLDFNLEVTGFEMGEIDLRIASLDDAIEASDDPADGVPEPSTVPPLSKVGDLWLLGPHHLLCGDARDPAPFAALMGEERAAMVFTTRPTTCRSMAMSAASALSIIARSRWHRAKWIGPNSPPFSVRFAGTLQHSALPARSTSFAWIGAMPKNS